VSSQLENAQPRFSAFDLSGSVAVVTGAGRGLGTEAAQALARAGALVAVTGRAPAALERACSLITEQGGRALMKVIDVNDEQSIEKAMAEILGDSGRLDILVNNAGVEYQERALAIGVTDWDRVINTNLRGTFLCTQKFALATDTTEPRCVINLSSMTASAAVKGQAVYCASKAGVEGLTRALALEFAPLNIRVNALAPGYFLTEMSRAVTKDSKLAERILRKIPLRRFGASPEIAGPIVFLASSASSYMTGATLHFDGGYTAE
jgi:NAD(P)-dependent dehydrogenase (short-subunit alcohol dehydrogenase family)